LKVNGKEREGSGGDKKTVCKMSLAYLDPGGSTRAFVITHTLLLTMESFVLCRVEAADPFVFGSAEGEFRSRRSAWSWSCGGASVDMATFFVDESC
jgi:hypothetical protein